MRPNRIGIFPVALNGTGGVQSSVTDITSVYDAARRTANKTTLDVVELFGGIAGEMHDTVYTKAIRWYPQGADAVNQTTTLDVNNRISFGGFVTVSDLRSENPTPRPLYCRMVGWAKTISTGSNDVPHAEPVIGIKTNSTPVTVGSTAADKLTRRCAHWVGLPTQHWHRYQVAGGSKTATINYCQTDLTFALAQTFSTTTGVGFSGETQFGVGWSFSQCAQISDIDITLHGELESWLSVWFYTADFDMHDPTKS